MDDGCNSNEEHQILPPPPPAPAGTGATGALPIARSLSSEQCSSPPTKKTVAGMSSFPLPPPRADAALLLIFPIIRSRPIELPPAPSSPVVNRPVLLPCGMVAQPTRRRMNHRGQRQHVYGANAPAEVVHRHVHVVPPAVVVAPVAVVPARRANAATAAERIPLDPVGGGGAALQCHPTTALLGERYIGGACWSTSRRASTGTAPSPPSRTATEASTPSHPRTTTTARRRGRAQRTIPPSGSRRAGRGCRPSCRGGATSTSAPASGPAFRRGRTRVGEVEGEPERGGEGTAAAGGGGGGHRGGRQGRRRCRRRPVGDGKGGRRR